MQLFTSGKLRQPAARSTCLASAQPHTRPVANGVRPLPVTPPSPVACQRTCSRRRDAVRTAASSQTGQRTAETASTPSSPAERCGQSAALARARKPKTTAPRSWRPHLHAAHQLACLRLTSPVCLRMFRVCSTQPTLSNTSSRPVTEHPSTAANTAAYTAPNTAPPTTRRSASPASPSAPTPPPAVVPVSTPDELRFDLFSALVRAGSERLSEAVTAAVDLTRTNITRAQRLLEPPPPGV